MTDSTCINWTNIFGNRWQPLLIKYSPQTNKSMPCIQLDIESDWMFLCFRDAITHKSENISDFPKWLLAITIPIDTKLYPIRLKFERERVGSSTNVGKCSVIEYARNTLIANTIKYRILWKLKLRTRFAPNKYEDWIHFLCVTFVLFHSHRMCEIRYFMQKLHWAQMIQIHAAISVLFSLACRLRYRFSIYSRRTVEIFIVWAYFPFDKRQ